MVSEASWLITIINGLVWFYGISTTVGYLIPNRVYKFVLNIYDLWTRFDDNILK